MDISFQIPVIIFIQDHFGHRKFVIYNVGHGVQVFLINFFIRKRSDGAIGCIINAFA